MGHRVLRLTAVLLLALSGVGFLTAGPVFARQDGDCAGVEEYIAELEATGAELESAMPGNDEDLDSWTSEEFIAASEAIAAAHETFAVIEPPAIAAEYHELLLQQIDMLSQMFATMSTAGVFGALIYVEQMDTLEADATTAAQAIEDACGVDLLDALEDETAATPVVIGIEGNDEGVDTSTGAVGTREDPIPLGETARIHPDWEMTVVSVSPDATELILTENTFNEPPIAGNQFFIATVRLTYVGETSDEFYVSDLSAVGQSAVGYNQFDDYCGTIPNELPSRELFTGGTIEGNVCWSIASEDADSLVLYDDYSDAEERVYLSMMPAAGDGSGATPVADSGLKAPVATAGAGGGDSASVDAEPVGLSLDGRPIMPIGASVQLNDAFSLTIVSVDQNAVDAVPDPAPEGYQYVNVEMTLEHLRDQTDTFDLISLVALGPGGAVYSAVGNSCGVVDGQLAAGDYTGTLSMTGNVCFVVHSRDIAGLALYDQTQPLDQKVYLSLDPAAGN